MSCTIQYHLCFQGGENELRERLERALAGIVKTQNVELVTQIYADEGESIEYLRNQLSEKAEIPAGQRYRLPLLGECAVQLGLMGMYGPAELRKNIEDYEAYRADPEAWRENQKARFKDPEEEMRPIDRLCLLAPHDWMVDASVRAFRESFLPFWKERLLKLPGKLGNLHTEDENPEEDETMRMAYNNMLFFQNMEILSEAVYEESRLLVAGIQIAAGCSLLKLKFTDWLASGLYFGKGDLSILGADDPVAAHLTALECLRILAGEGLVVSIGDYSRYLYTGDEDILRWYLGVELAFADMVQSAARTDPEGLVRMAVPDLDVKNVTLKNPPRDPLDIQREHRANQARKN